MNEIPHPRFSRWIATHRFTLYEIRLLLYLLSRLDTEHFRRVTMQVASFDLQIGPQHLSKTLRKLLDMGLVQLGPRCGRNYTLRLNPRIVLHGEVPGHDRSSFVETELRETGIWPDYENEVVSQRNEVD